MSALRTRWHVQLRFPGSLVAALAGQPEIGLGDALGSNVVNIALIFGLALLFGAIQTSRQDFGRDYYMALAIPVLTQCCSLYNHWRPIVTDVERFVALAGAILLGSSFDQAGVGSSSGARTGACGDGVNQLLPPLRELLWGEGRRWWGVCGA